MLQHSERTQSGGPRSLQPVAAPPRSSSARPSRRPSRGVAGWALGGWFGYPDTVLIAA
jgi:hypothetical protein